MIKVTTGYEEFELKAYCQNWLELIAARDFDAAGKLVDAPNCYGLSWGKQEIMAVIEDHFGESIEFNIQNYDLSMCEPNFLQRNDGGLLYDFNLPINGELSDLTVMFEFNPKQNQIFEVVIHDIHML